MKKGNRANKKAAKKDCPYCGYFKPCGNCEAKKHKAEQRPARIKVTSLNLNKER